MAYLNEIFHLFPEDNKESHQDTKSGHVVTCLRFELDSMQGLVLRTARLGLSELRLFFCLKGEQQVSDGTCIVGYWLSSLGHSRVSVQQTHHAASGLYKLIYQANKFVAVMCPRMRSLTASEFET